MTSERVSCEWVRELLPEHAEPGLRPAGPVEVHLAGCSGCRGELAQYRMLLSSLADVRLQDLEPPPAFLEETLRAVRLEAVRRRIPNLAEIRNAGSRVASSLRDRGTVRYALVSIGGAAVGATAIAIVWWSVAHRGLSSAGTAAGLQ